ncbi:MAG TPA: cupredoxin domain-containing protein [Archangium sp.]|jgi:plastocyanin domain-containing protein|nr:cupredoxin domain-containing protein [Archangium sp.]
MKKILLGALAAVTLVAATPAVACDEHTKQAASTAKPATAPVGKNGVRTVEVTVTSKGFEPANVKVKAGHPVRLVVTRKTEKTCATEIILDDLGINQPLPLDTPVTVEFTPSESGTLRYACAMDHIRGVVTIQ